MTDNITTGNVRPSLRLKSVLKTKLVDGELKNCSFSIWGFNRFNVIFKIHARSAYIGKIRNVKIHVKHPPPS